MEGVKNASTAISISLLIALTVVLSSPEHVLACAMAFAQHTVGTSFLVEGSYNGRPLPDTIVEISRETDKEPYLVDSTAIKLNEKGQTVIHGLVPGKYFLFVKHAQIDGEAVELNVVGDEDADAFTEETLRLGWPNKKVFEARKMSGTVLRAHLDFTKHLPEPPLAGAKLTLTDAVTGTQRNGVVRNDGSFAFPGLANGFYILHIKQESADQEEGIDGDIFVEVLPHVKDNGLPLLRLYMSDCGIGMRGKDGTEIF